jgi:hypothetical protein
MHASGCLKNLPDTSNTDAPDTVAVVLEVEPAKNFSSGKNSRPVTKKNSVEKSVGQK